MPLSGSLSPSPPYGALCGLPGAEAARGKISGTNVRQAVQSGDQFARPMISTSVSFGRAYPSTTAFLSAPLSLCERSTFVKTT